MLPPRRGWDMGSELCQATGFLLTFLGIASINNLVAISVFRYLVIHYANVRTVTALLRAESKVNISEQLCGLQQESCDRSHDSLLELEPGSGPPTLAGLGPLHH